MDASTFEDRKCSMVPRQPRNSPKRETGKGSGRNFQRNRPPKRTIPQPQEDDAVEEWEETQPKSSMGLMAKMLQRHEHALQMTEADRSFVVFLSTRDSSILPKLYKSCQEWKVSCNSPLRAAFMACLLMELQARLRKAETEPLLKLSQAAGWLNQAQQWKFLE